MGCNCNAYKKSTIEAIATAPQLVATDGALEYTLFRETGAALEAMGATGIRINKPGLYLVLFNGSAAEGGTAGNITVQLLRDGQEVAGATATAISAAATANVNLGFSTVVEVLGSCGCVSNRPTLTVQNQGTGATFIDASFKVVKLA